MNESTLSGLLLGGLLVSVACTSSMAATFALPMPGNDLIGQIQSAEVGDGETLLDIARRYDLGYRDIIAANPDLDPWLPAVGARVTLPTRFILPSAPRKGIVVNLAEMRLYYFSTHDPGDVMTYPLGIGRQGWDTPLGVTHVTAKVKDPVWTVPDSIQADAAAQGRPLPKIVPPGPDNPLGKYALRLDLPGYLIHGTNKPFGVGRRISHGCLRMYPEDIEELFRHADTGTRVWIINLPYKVGRQDGLLYLEAHRPIAEGGQEKAGNLVQVIASLSAVTEPARKQQAVKQARIVAARHQGLPISVAVLPAYQEQAAEGWVIQLGAFKNITNAMQLAHTVRTMGMPVSIKARVNDGYCHVLVGPYRSVAGAEEKRSQLARHTGYRANVLPAARYGMLTDCMP